MKDTSYTNTKLMLEKIRNINSKELLTEEIDEKVSETEEEVSDEDTDDGIAITDSPEFGEQTLTNQKETIINKLKLLINFSENPLIYYPKSMDLIFSGEVSSLKMKWQFRLNDPNGDGCYIWADEFQLTKENVDKINQLRGYYLAWRDEWIANNRMLDTFDRVSD